MKIRSEIQKLSEKRRSCIPWHQTSVAGSPHVTPRDTAGLSSCNPWHYTSVRGLLHVTPKTQLFHFHSQSFYMRSGKRDRSICLVIRLSTKSRLAKISRRRIRVRAVQSRVLHQQSNPHLHPERNGTKVPPPASLGPPAYIRLPRLLYHNSILVSKILFFTSAMSVFQGVHQTDKQNF